jgi:hypothetical protein
MPPIGNRATSDARCAEGWKLRQRGHTWEHIAHEIGYRSKQSAQQAIQGWLKRNPPDDIETLRRATGDILIETIGKLRDTLDVAISKGQTTAVAELGRAVFDGCDRYAKLTGQHIVPPTEVNVTMTITEAIEGTRKRLLGAIDAEVVDVVEAKELEQ